MKKFLLIAFLLTLFFGLNQISNAAVNETKTEKGYISLSESKTQDADPNMAKITFAIENTDDDAQKAAYENNKISNEIINALKQIAIQDQDIIKTNNYSIRPVYSTNSSGKRVIRNYTAVNSITVETKNISEVSKFIDTALANGANRTEGLSYTFDNEKSVCKELYPEIIKDLRQQADTLAHAAGTSVSGIKSLRVSCGTSYASSSRLTAYSRSSSLDNDLTEDTAPAVVEPGKVKVRVNVNADFYVK